MISNQTRPSTTNQQENHGRSASSPSSHIAVYKYSDPDTFILISAFLDFEFWDLPGGRYDIERSQNFDASTLGSCIFVIDAQVRRPSPRYPNLSSDNIPCRRYKAIMPTKRESTPLYLHYPMTEHRTDFNVNQDRRRHLPDTRAERKDDL